MYSCCQRLIVKSRSDMHSHALPPSAPLLPSSAMGGPRGPSQAQLTLLLAWLTTAVGVAMAAAAAFERAGATLDRGLITAIAILLALGAHLLPALARRLPWAWLLWGGCVLATLYGHAHFFTASSQRAGVQRAGALAPSHQTQAWQSELAAIQTRPLSTVAADQARLETRLSQAQDALTRCERSTPSQCRAAGLNASNARAKLEANQVELAQARRAAELRTHLTDAAALRDQQRSQLHQDPVDSLLARWLGVPVVSFGLALSLVQSLLVELLAALLWTLALHRPPAAAADVPAARPALQPPAEPPLVLPELLRLLQRLGVPPRSGSGGNAPPMLPGAGSAGPSRLQGDSTAQPAAASPEAKVGADADAALPQAVPPAAARPEAGAAKRAAAPKRRGSAPARASRDPLATGARRTLRAANTLH